MKFIVALVGAAFAATIVLPDNADAAQRGYRNGKARYHKVVTRRPASVGPNGLCQRDTGTPTGQLNFRNRCDTEEFWNRMNERGNFGRR